MAIKCSRLSGLKGLDEGDKIIIEGRSMPVTVVEEAANAFGTVVAEGPFGGEIKIKKSNGGFTTSADGHVENVWSAAG